ncbi:hypothetical protein Vretifemale_6053 [Volvox reticuliferus]|uniref:Uncharacterized protein n=1 Tax=Volvox reticuliferus TaxID=1737510 RepID=A0A8J4C6N8_9CHLO|nr:hypothetical protein Vretifemale_6053 [Volvox reticuliferus]
MEHFPIEIPMPLPAPTASLRPLQLGKRVDTWQGPPYDPSTLQSYLNTNPQTFPTRRGYVPVALSSAPLAPSPWSRGALLLTPIFGRRTPVSTSQIAGTAPSSTGTLARALCPARFCSSSPSKCATSTSRSTRVAPAEAPLPPSPSPPPPPLAPNRERACGDAVDVKFKRRLAVGL